MSQALDALNGIRVAVAAPSGPALYGTAENIAAELLSDLAAFVRRFVVLSNRQSAIIALWIAHTHAIEAFEATPFLSITSAEKQSGKTRLLEVLELLTRAPLRAVSASESAIFRTIEKDTPTLLLDEVDSIFGPKARDNEPLRAILNAGNRRGAYVLRVEGEKTRTVVHFPVFCPRALAGIGRLPDTVADRSFPIRLKRRALAELVEKFRRREVEPLAERLHARLEVWAAQAVARLTEARPRLPEELSDRQAEGVEPLLAIADLAGGEWPENARVAIVEIYVGQEAVEDSAGLRLLGDLREIYEEGELFASDDLCKRLNGREEAGWGGWHEGEGINSRDLARLLKPYEIRPRKHRTGPATIRGYAREELSEAWRRWLPRSPQSPSAETEQVEQPEQGKSGGLVNTGPVPHVPDVPGLRTGVGSAPCRYHVGPPSQPCSRTDCGRSYREHLAAGAAAAE